MSDGKRPRVPLLLLLLAAVPCAGLAQSNPPAYRRRNARVYQVQLYIIDLRLVCARRTFKLAYQRILSVQLLLGNYPVFIKLLKSV